MTIPRDRTFVVSEQLLNQREPRLYERFARLAEKYEYRDLARAAANAIRAWVDTHEPSDTGCPPPVTAEAMKEGSAQVDTDPLPPAPHDDGN